MKNESVMVGTTFEELGKGQNVGVDVEVHFTVWPAEPMTLDYPGCPAEAEYTYCTVTKAWGENWEINRQDRPDWFDVLDDIIDTRIYNCDNNWELLE